MVVVADGGATKIDWTWMNEEGVRAHTQTSGFNPTYVPESRPDSLQKELKALPFGEKPFQLFYYGAGCKAQKAVESTLNLLIHIWPAADISVFDDLLGAARATCGGVHGVVCILGTGSNSMHFDGENEVERIPNLGIMLGDEGSGAHIGKALMRSYFYREMPHHISQTVAAALPGGRDGFIKELYSSSPGTYLASFVKLVADKASDPWVASLIRSCFDEFLAKHVEKYQVSADTPVHFCGSIAYHFEAILTKALLEKKLAKGVILRKPIDELFKFHLNNASSQPFSSDRK